VRAICQAKRGIDGGGASRRYHALATWVDLLLAEQVDKEWGERMAVCGGWLVAKLYLYNFLRHAWIVILQFPCTHMSPWLQLCLCYCSTTHRFHGFSQLMSHPTFFSTFVHTRDCL
jgi:hypothetical protein